MWLKMGNANVNLILVIYCELCLYLLPHFYLMTMTLTLCRVLFVRGCYLFYVPLAVFLV